LDQSQRGPGLDVPCDDHIVRARARRGIKSVRCHVIVVTARPLRPRIEGSLEHRRVERGGSSQMQRQALVITEDVEQKGAEPVGYLVVPVSIPGGTLRDLRRGEPLKLIFGRARPARQAATPAAEELPQE